MLLTSFMILLLGFSRKVHGAGVVLYGDQTCAYGASDSLSGGALFSTDVSFNCLPISQGSELGGAYAAKGFTTGSRDCTFQFFSTSSCTASSLMHTISTATTACTCLDMTAPVAAITVTCVTTSSKREIGKRLLQPEKRQVCNINLQNDEVVYAIPDYLDARYAGGIILGITDVEVGGGPFTTYPPTGDARNTLVEQLYEALVEEAELQYNANSITAVVNDLEIQIDTAQYILDGQTFQYTVIDLIVTMGREATVAQITAALNRMTTVGETGITYDIRLDGINGPHGASVFISYS